MIEPQTVDRPEIVRLSTRWDAETIEVSRIRWELDELWRQWALRSGAAVESNSTSGREQVYMRPSTVNVIAVTESVKEAATTAELLISWRASSTFPKIACTCSCPNPMDHWFVY